MAKKYHEHFSPEFTHLKTIFTIFPDNFLPHPSFIQDTFGAY